MRRAKMKTTRKKAVRISGVRKGAKVWTAVEVATLRRTYKTQSATQIAKTLRRSVSSVKAKVRTLGLKKKVQAKSAAKKATSRRKVAKRRTVAKKKMTRKAATKKKPARKAAAKKKKAKRR